MAHTNPGWNPDQLAIAPDASCFMPIASLPFFVSLDMESFDILSCFMASFPIVSFAMLSFFMVSCDIASFDMAPLACAKAAVPLVRKATASAAIANFFMGLLRLLWIERAGHAGGCPKLLPLEGRAQPARVRSLRTSCSPGRPNSRQGTYS